MKSGYVRCGLTMALVLGFVSAPSQRVAAQGRGGGNSAAQEAEDAKLKAMPTPHTADGHTDLTGYWGAPEVPGETKISEGGKFIEFQVGTPKEALASRGNGRGGRGPQAAPNVPEYKPDQLAKVKELHDNQTDLDPEYHCMPMGVPRIGPPTEILQIPNAVAFLYGSGNIFRIIPTDGRKHDPKLDDSYMGDSAGRWEGNTLVVDIANFNDETWLAGGGDFHSTGLHVVERLTRQGNTILYEVTAEDPTVLVKPWVLAPRTLRLGKAGTHIVEDPPCQEMDRPHMTDKSHSTP